MATRAPHPLRFAVALVPLLLLAACDSAKKFIDPSGQSFPPPSGVSPVATPSGAVPTSAVPDPTAAPGGGIKALDSASALPRLLGMSCFTGGDNLALRGGRWKGPGREVSILDSLDRPWGLAVADLNQDGWDDAVVLVATTRSSGRTWELALVLNQGGQLANTTTLPLQGSPSGLRATGANVELVAAGGAVRRFAYVGGGLVEGTAP